MKSTIYAVMILVMGLAVAWSVAAEKETRPNAAQTVTTTLTNDVVAALVPGTTLAQAHDIIGCQPLSVEMIVSSSNDKMEQHFWKDRFGSTLFLRFKNGALSEVLMASIKH